MKDLIRGANASELEVWAINEAVISTETRLHNTQETFLEIARTHVWANKRVRIKTYSAVTFVEAEKAVVNFFLLTFVQLIKIRYTTDVAAAAATFVKRQRGLCGKMGLTF